MTPPPVILSEASEMSGVERSGWSQIKQDTFDYAFGCAQYDAAEPRAPTIMKENFRAVILLKPLR